MGSEMCIRDRYCATTSTEDLADERGVPTGAPLHVEPVIPTTSSVNVVEEVANHDLTGVEPFGKTSHSDDGLRSGT